MTDTRSLGDRLVDFSARAPLESPIDLPGALASEASLESDALLSVCRRGDGHQAQPHVDPCGHRKCLADGSASASAESPASKASRDDASFDERSGGVALSAHHQRNVGGGIVIARFGDIRVGTLLVDSVGGNVLGRVTKWSLTGAKSAGKPLRRRMTIEIEEDSR